MYRSNFNRTKIVATIGPATCSREMLKNIILAGVDVCRINSSHGTHADHLEVIKHIRSINEELNSDVCILQDLQGPKLRIGLIENDAIEITKGQILTLTSNEMIGNAEKICIRYVDLANDVKPGELILIDDGKIELNRCRSECCNRRSSEVQKRFQFATHGCFISQFDRKRYHRFAVWIRK